MKFPTPHRVSLDPFYFTVSFCLSCSLHLSLLLPLSHFVCVSHCCASFSLIFGRPRNIPQKNPFVKARGAAVPSSSGRQYLLRLLRGFNQSQPISRLGLTIQGKNMGSNIYTLEIQPISSTKSSSSEVRSAADHGNYGSDHAAGSISPRSLVSQMRIKTGSNPSSPPKDVDDDSEMRYSQQYRGDARLPMVGPIPWHYQWTEILWCVITQTLASKWNAKDKQVLSWKFRFQPRSYL